MVGLETLQMEDEKLIRKLLDKHLTYTNSVVAGTILDDFVREKRKFVKVMPIEYKRVLMDKKRALPAGGQGEEEEDDEEN
jgi:glutamate synthase domain-containing protein 3